MNNWELLEPTIKEKGEREKKKKKENTLLETKKKENTLLETPLS